MPKPPIGPTAEKTVRYAANVRMLEVAWAFVLSHVDEFRAPKITITPKWVTGPGWAPGDEWMLEFEVSVEGLVDA